MRPSIGSFRELLAAARIVGRYLAMMPQHPARTQRFIGTLLRYTAAYSHHALYPQHLPERFLHDILPGVAQQEIPFRHTFENKALPYGEAYVVAVLTAFLRPKRVFEIGTYTGATSLLIAEQAGPDCQVYTLELPPGAPQTQLPHDELDPPEDNASLIGIRFRGTKYERQITQLYGDSAAFDYSPYLGQMDLVFVDGSHSYDYVLSDTNKALRLINAHGTIIWDDCATQHPGVARALDRYGAKVPIYRIIGTRLAIHTRRAG